MLLSCSLISILLTIVTAQSESPKRGLVYVGNTQNSVNDISAWTSQTDLTWYYNYGSSPTPQLAGSSLHFVPMLWGPPAKGKETEFLDTVTSMQKGGANITHVLGFNEPDGEKKTGGTSMSASDASSVWQKQMEPLKKLGIKLGAPVVTGSPRGYGWLKDWEKACKGKCNPDFLPVHWYGNFDGLASWVGNMTTTYPELEVWVTEFALPQANLQDTQSFFNKTIALLDRWENVTRYSYFGAFRSDVSNIGPAAAMLSEKGKLTDIGSWYLGGKATGVKPKGSDATRTAESSMLLLLALTAVIMILA